MIAVILAVFLAAQPLSWYVLAECGATTNLSHYEGEAVVVKGFLGQAQDGRWVLSAQPGLKSCCAGQPGKVAQQVVVEGNFATEALDTLIQAKGTFAVEAIRDEEGQIVQLYLLRDAQLVQGGGSTSWGWGALAMGFVGLGLFAFRRKDPEG